MMTVTVVMMAITAMPNIRRTTIDQVISRKTTIRMFMMSDRQITKPT